jgi:hypothetical protein
VFFQFRVISLDMLGLLDLDFRGLLSRYFFCSSFSVSAIKFSPFAVSLIFIFILILMSASGSCLSMALRVPFLDCRRNVSPAPLPVITEDTIFVGPPHRLL